MSGGTKVKGLKVAVEELKKAVWTWHGGKRWHAKS